MQNDKVIIKIDGKVSVADFRTVVDAFCDLMITLTAETNSEAAVEWMIADLRASSALLESRGITGNQESEHTVELVIGKYEALAKSAGEGRLERYSDPVQLAVRSISSVINGKIPRILMGTPDRPEIGTLDKRIEAIDAAQAKAIFGPRNDTRTAVKGQVVLLDQKQTTYFTLREAYGYNLIRCYPSEEHRANLGRYWSDKTWIIVEGTMRRAGDMRTLTQITDIVEMPPEQKGGWRTAVGASPRIADSSSMSAVEAVRKVRDGQA